MTIWCLGMGRAATRIGSSRTPLSLSWFSYIRRSTCRKRTTWRTSKTTIHRTGIDTRMTICKWSNLGSKFTNSPISRSLSTRTTSIWPQYCKASSPPVSSWSMGVTTVFWVSSRSSATGTSLSLSLMTPKGGSTKRVTCFRCKSTYSGRNRTSSSPSSTRRSLTNSTISNTITSPTRQMWTGGSIFTLGLNKTWSKSMKGTRTCWWLYLCRIVIGSTYLRPSCKTLINMMARSKLFTFSLNSKTMMLTSTSSTTKLIQSLSTSTGSSSQAGETTSFSMKQTVTSEEELW